MSRSAQGPPLRLIPAQRAIKRVLADGPMTAREISDALRAEGFEWPLPPGRWNAPRHGPPTPARVRRCLNPLEGRSVRYVQESHPERWELVEKEVARAQKC